MIPRLIFTFLFLAGLQNVYGMAYFAKEWPSVIPVRVSVKNPTKHIYTYTVFDKNEVIKPSECIHYHGFIDGNNPATAELIITFKAQSGWTVPRSVIYVNGMKNGMWINFCSINTGVIDLNHQNSNDLRLKQSVIAIELDLSRDSDFGKHCKVVPNDPYLFSFDKIVAHNLDSFKKDQENKVYKANTFLKCAQRYKDSLGNSSPIEYRCYDNELKKSVNNMALVETAFAQCRRTAPKIVIEHKEASNQEPEDSAVKTIIDMGIMLWDVLKL